MKRLLKGIFSAAVMGAAVLGTAVTAAAEDVSIDVSEAVESTGWGQSITVTRSQFDARRITKDTVIKVAFDAGDYSGEELPIELIFQSWSNTTSPNADSNGEVWAKVTAEEYSTSSATFTYDAIVEAYGTDDLSQVQAIHVGDNDKAPITCKGLIITECTKAKETIDVSVDCGDAKKATMFGTSLTVRYTVFDTTTLTSNSKVLVSYTLDSDESELTKSPVAIAMQSWEKSNSPYADSKGDVWVTVQPESWGDGKAEFSYNALVEAYGTADFTRLSALNFCDNGETAMQVNEITFTECVSADKGTHAAEEEAPADESAEESSEAEESKDEESKAEQAPAAAVTDDSSDSSEKKSSNLIFVIIGIVAGVGLAVAVIFIILTKESSQEYDIDKRRMVSKKKPKNNTKW